MRSVGHAALEVISKGLVRYVVGPPSLYARSLSSVTSAVEDRCSTVFLRRTQNQIDSMSDPVPKSKNTTSGRDPMKTKGTNVLENSKSNATLDEPIRM